ncbi:MAG: hypothetical protein ABR559_07025, partial [Gemmatimonadota bacterium]
MWPGLALAVLLVLGCQQRQVEDGDETGAASDTAAALDVAPEAADDIASTPDTSATSETTAADTAPADTTRLDTATVAQEPPASVAAGAAPPSRPRAEDRVSAEASSAGEASANPPA